jgi:hypothetical protein
MIQIAWRRGHFALSSFCSDMIHKKQKNRHKKRNFHKNRLYKNIDHATIYKTNAIRENFQGYDVTGNQEGESDLVALDRNQTIGRRLIKWNKKTKDS